MRRPNIPLEIGNIHIVGIGGIGMSGIAEVLAHWGYKVQGSDAKDGPNLERLRKAGITTFVAVSYTHLDVYKRQHPHHPFQAFPGPSTPLKELYPVAALSFYPESLCHFLR